MFLISLKNNVTAVNICTVIKVLRRPPFILNVGNTICQIALILTTGIIEAWASMKLGTFWANLFLLNGTGKLIFIVLNLQANLAVRVDPTFLPKAETPSHV